jgi:lysophospholipase L1-like esterase
VLFVGSSSIRLWGTRESFPHWPVINRGFGGSRISDVNDRFDQVVQPYRARVIVLYAGDNDIAAGKKPDAVRDDFTEFVAKVRASQPDTPIVFLSIKPSTSRWKRWPHMQQANALIRAVCESEPHLLFVDVASPILGENGLPRPDLFLPDNLHLSQAGYEVWTRILTPIISPIIEPYLHTDRVTSHKATDPGSP